MASILGSKISNPRLDGNDDGCFCSIKAKQINVVVMKFSIGNVDYGPDGDGPPIYYLRKTEESDIVASHGNPILFFGQPSGASILSNLWAELCGGVGPGYTLSTKYKIVREIVDPRIYKSKITECGGAANVNIPWGSTFSGPVGCQGEATFSLRESGECGWDGAYESHESSGAITAPLIQISEEKITYDRKYDYEILKGLTKELLNGCDFDDKDFDWGHKRRAEFKESDDGSGVDIACGETSSLFSHIWDNDKNEFLCSPCSAADAHHLIVELYTNYREEEGRSWIQASRVRFVPKTDHYWKIYVPQLFYDYKTEKMEERSNFPIVCELVKTTAGEPIDIDPPKDPGHYIIRNCAKDRDLSLIDSRIGEDGEVKNYGCMEKKNFPRILEDA